nr:threonylcarbamoyl-AMP synthase [Propionibacterium sp.]
MSTGEQGPRVFDTSADAEAAFEAAADAVAAGEVIVLPTDTVYGVGADPFSPQAVQRLLDAKRRGRDMPPPVLVAEVEMVRSLVRGVDDRLDAIARAFWPGPLTLIATAPDSLRMDLGDRGSTIAVRVPDHEFTRELLRRTGPLAVSSANISGRDAALTIADAVDQLGDTVSVYLDGGTMSGPVPSTIIDLSGPRPRLLRAGRLTVAEINAVVPGLLEDPDRPEGATQPDAVPPADAVADQPGEKGD